jgi:hypothetical protein
LALDVGGLATVIPGTVINIHCPVRRFSRNNIVWRHGEKVYTRKGRVKVAGRGVLRIRKSRKSDAGVYTCIAGQDSAEVIVKFHSIDDARDLAEKRFIHQTETAANEVGTPVIIELFMGQGYSHDHGTGGGSW